MVVSRGAEQKERLAWHRTQPGKLILLVLVQALGVLFPLTFFVFGVWGGRSFGFTLLCAIVESAVFFYGMDLLTQTRSPYLWSLSTFFMTSVGVGTLGYFAIQPEIRFHDGSCFVISGPTYLLFALYHLENLIPALIISPLWMAIRWIENSIQVMRFRQKHQKVL